MERLLTGSGRRRRTASRKAPPPPPPPPPVQWLGGDAARRTWTRAVSAPLDDMVLDPGVVRAIGAERAAPLSLLVQQRRSGSTGGDQDGSDSGSTQGERRWLLRRAQETSWMIRR
ncbi:hypothetical protein FJT64_001597 [Amphibalanus amphitrite]|uniref:Uncharacterized protein n=1 Tax=Amphibalanus amphitrite TaxID=1232801 RepID=A0A6A4X3W8_AMPAM|nr:hypothetical protein FJT64_001597 [Amphibalanus amphitrite]